MLWVIAAAGPLGVLLGLRYKVASLIAASGAVAVLICAFTLWASWPLEPSALTILGSLVALQAGYFIGLLLSGRRG